MTSLTLQQHAVAARTALKVLAGHYDNTRVILACRTKEDFKAVTRIPHENIYGPTTNQAEVAVAMKTIGTPFGRPIRALDGEWTEWTKPPSSKKKRNLTRQFFQLH
jgi:hypothetical protein